MTGWKSTTATTEIKGQFILITQQLEKRCQRYEYLDEFGSWCWHMDIERNCVLMSTYECLDELMLWCQLVRMWYGDMWNMIYWYVECQHVRMWEHALHDVYFTRFWECMMMLTLRMHIAYDWMSGMHEIENVCALHMTRCWVRTNLRMCMHCVWPDVRYCTQELSTFLTIENENDVNYNVVVPEY